MPADANNRHAVVTRIAFEAIGGFQGFRSHVTPYFPALLHPPKLFHVDKDIVEKDLNLKQLVVYLMVKRKDGCILAYYRNNKSDPRLKGKRTIGIGGHVSWVDMFHEPEAILNAAGRRELVEEGILGEDQAVAINWLGLVNDETDDVGKMHLGIVGEVTVEQDFVLGENARTELLDAEFVPPIMLMATKDTFAAFEGWSQLVLMSLDI